MDTVKQQAEGLFNREFARITFAWLEDRAEGIEILYPTYTKNKDGFKNKEEFQDYLYENHYPMCGTIFLCDEFFTCSDYCNVDTLYALGIGAMNIDINNIQSYAIFIPGAGYDFYDTHWIPLFKYLCWIKKG